MGSKGESLSILLNRVNRKESRAWSRLYSKTAADLRKMAHVRLFRRPVKDLRSTELADLTLCQLKRNQRTTWKGRSHFFGAVEKVMNWLHIDFIRKEKRHARVQHLADLDVLPDGRGHHAEDRMWLEDVLTHLETQHPDLGKVMRMYLEGHTLKQIATNLDLSTSTAHRKLRTARVWLYRELCS